MGIFAYVVPLDRYAKTYDGHPLSYAGISSEKNHVSVHRPGMYCERGRNNVVTFRNKPGSTSRASGGGLVVSDCSLR